MPDHPNTRVGGFRSGDFESSGEGKKVINDNIVFTGEVQGGSGVGESIGERFFESTVRSDPSSSSSNGPNDIGLLKVFLPYPMIAKTLSYELGPSTSTEFAVGLYSEDLKLLFQVLESAPAAGVDTKNLGSGISLSPGFYWFAQGGTGGVLSFIANDQDNVAYMPILNAVRLVQANFVGGYQAGSGLPSSILRSQLSANVSNSPYFVLQE